VSPHPPPLLSAVLPGRLQAGEAGGRSEHLPRGGGRGRVRRTRLGGGAGRAPAGGRPMTTWAELQSLS